MGGLLQSLGQGCSGPTMAASHLVQISHGGPATDGQPFPFLAGGDVDVVC
ncbi:MAG: hypothetical protein ACE5FN_09340 [Leptospirillia bacterium]